MVSRGRDDDKGKGVMRRERSDEERGVMKRREAERGRRITKENTEDGTDERESDEERK